MPATHYAGLDISDPPSCTSTTYLATGHRLDNREPPKLDIHDRGTREDGLLVSTKSLRRVEIGVTIEQKPGQRRRRLPGPSHALIGRSRFVPQSLVSTKD